MSRLPAVAACASMVVGAGVAHYLGWSAWVALGMGFALGAVQYGLFSLGTRRLGATSVARQRLVFIGCGLAGLSLWGAELILSPSPSASRFVSLAFAAAGLGVGLFHRQVYPHLYEGAEDG